MIGKNVSSMQALRVALIATPLAMLGAQLACSQSGNKPQEQPKTAITTAAVHTLGLFEIDNNTPNAGGTAGDDWQNTIGDPTIGNGGTATSGATATTFVHDGAEAFSIFTGGGSKDDEPVGKWKWKNGGGLPDKDNIVNAYAAAYTNPNNGHLILYFGADRFDASGDAMMGFWFFKDSVLPVPDPNTADSGTFSGAHQDGDLLVLVNFLNGGSENHIQVLKWQGDATTGGLVVVAGEVVSSASPFCNGADTACAATNKDGSTTAYWLYTAKGVGTTTAIPQNSFIEGGIDATQLAGTNCVASFLAETRSSTSVTAVLKDFAAGSFVTCGLTLTKDCTGTTLGVVTQDAGDGGSTSIVVPQIGFSGRVCNSGVGTLSNVTVTDNIPGQPPVIYDVGPLSGDACATFSGSYVPSQVDDGGTNPCTATFTNTVNAVGTFGDGGVVEAGPASAVCPLCPCNVSDAGGG